MIMFDVCEGVHTVVHGDTNCYVIESDDGLTLVDAAYPSTWDLVQRCLDSLRRSTDDIRGLIITHGHFDHLGFAASVQQRFGVPVWVHPGDFPLAAHPYSYRPERPRLLYPLAYPGSVPVLMRMVAAGALRVPGFTPDRELQPGAVLDLPGRPQVIATPGHTDGECVFLLADRRILLTGDALVTLDPYTGFRGPRIIARAATHDSRQALESVASLAALGVDHVLPGHGELWQYGIESAVQSALQNGGR
jgi:glyoxylase-like metal-dependent hydrolase (beta-lactamase superfamily II)